jgi:hypothetical protein
VDLAYFLLEAGQLSPLIESQTQNRVAAILAFYSET